MAGDLRIARLPSSRENVVDGVGAVASWLAVLGSAAAAGVVCQPEIWRGKAARAEVAERARERGIETVIFAPGQSLEALVGKPWPMVRTRWGLPVATGRRRSWPQRPSAHGLPFVCVPAGTRNHFALDLGVDPHDVLGALDAFTDGIERLIDVADVNGRVFLNNVSLGIYGDAVRSPAYRDAKMRTLLETAEKVLGPRAEVPALRLVDDVGREHQHLALVLVSNNPTRSIAR